MSRAVSITEHRALVEGALPVLDPVELPLERCRGLVAAAPVEALLPVPPFTNSAMDGFAVRAQDLVPDPDGVVDLPVAGDVPAGDTRRNALEPGTAWRIMTGAPVPEGADTVVKVEMTDHAAGISEAPARVRIHELPAPGANVRMRGEAVAPGALVLPAGTVLEAGALAAAASVGRGSLLVHRRPRVLVVVTGSELAAPGEPLSHGRIPDSNGLMLAALVEEAGAEVAGVLVVRDEPAEFLRLLARSPEADLVVTAGGISEGAFEVVRLAIGERGLFHHVAQQPGGPQGVGVLPLGPSAREVPVICLPGNPVSVFVSFHVYVAGALARMAGRGAAPADAAPPSDDSGASSSDSTGSTAPALVDGIAAARWTSPKAKTQFIPVREARPQEIDAAPAGALDSAGARVPVVPVHALGSGSHLVSSLADADYLAVVPEEVREVVPGLRLDLIPVLGRNPRR